jgi:hypothetical protein
LGDDFLSSAALMLRPLAIVAATLFPLAFGTLASDLQMKIDDVRFDNGAVVKFLSVASDQVPVNPDTLSKMRAGQTGEYIVFADVGSITVNPSFENYDFYVRSTSAPLNAPLTRFSFQVTPYDTFPDQDKTVQIHLLEGAQVRTVELPIPVHSLKAGTSLWTQLDANVKVRLAGDTISIDLENKYSLPVTITDARVAEVPTAHWTSQPVLVSSVPLVLGSDENNNRTTLTWRVQPRASGVLHDSLIAFSTNSSKEGSGSGGSAASGADHETEALDNLEFSIGYVPTEGGFPHTLKAHRSVYFFPSFPALAAVASLGALAGGLVMFYGIRKDSGSLKFLKYLWPNIILAVIIELIAIVLFSLDHSNIQIGVVNLNPTLLIPAACLGAISVFYGFQIVEKWLGKAGPETPSADTGVKKP